MPKKSVAVTLRKPQTPADPEAFVVSGSAVAKAPVAPATSALEAAVEVQHGAQSYREMTLYLPTEVARKLSFYCMDHHRDANHVVAEAVQRYVAMPASGPAPSAPPSIWNATFEILIEKSRLKLSTLWALRRWAARAE